MAKPIKFWNCRFPRSEGRRVGGSEGMVLVILMIAATLLLIALTAALPSVYQEGQREREAELIFRGTQYGRAVALFHRQFGRYPTSTKELLQTNNIRFLRKEYLDPMDPNGKWRFIHVNAAGVLLDSVNQPVGANPNNPNPAGIGTNSSPSSMLGGNASLGNSARGGFSLGGSSLGGSSSFGSPGSAGGMGMNSPSGGSGQTGSSSSFSGNSNDVPGAFIAGVAATSHHASIKIWHKHDHYDEWEFLGIDMGIFGVQVGMPGSMGMGQPSTFPGMGSAPGTTAPTSSPTTFGPPSN